MTVTTIGAVGGGTQLFSASAQGGAVRVNNGGESEEANGAKGARGHHGHRGGHHKKIESQSSDSSKAITNSFSNTSPASADGTQTTDLSSSPDSAGLVNVVA